MFKPGRVQQEFAGIVDLLPTICDFAGIEPQPDYDGVPCEIDGISLKNALVSGAPTGGGASVGRGASVGHGASVGRDAIFCESTVLKEPDNSGCMIRTGKWKYNHYLDGFDELYDMENDPVELNNLVNDPAYANIAKDLRGRVIKFWEPDKQLERYNATPMMRNEKHFNFYSNQFMLGDGFVIDARP